MGGALQASLKATTQYAPAISFGTKYGWLIQMRQACRYGMPYTNIVRGLREMGIVQRSF